MNPFSQTQMLEVGNEHLNELRSEAAIARQLPAPWLSRVLARVFKYWAQSLEQDSQSTSVWFFPKQI